MNTSQQPCETLADSLSFFSRPDKRSVECVNADYSTPKTQWQAPRNPATRSGHLSNGPCEGRAVSSAQSAPRAQYLIEQKKLEQSENWPCLY